MPLYLTRFSYTPAAWAKLVTNPEDRRAAATQYIEAVGGTMHGVWYAFGEHDGYTLRVARLRRYSEPPGHVCGHGGRSGRHNGADFRRCRLAPIGPERLHYAHSIPSVESGSQHRSPAAESIRTQRRPSMAVISNTVWTRLRSMTLALTLVALLLPTVLTAPVSADRRGEDRWQKQGDQGEGERHGAQSRPDGVTDDSHGWPPLCADRLRRGRSMMGPCFHTRYRES